jgi:TetR/AcrR family transcriptional regulator, fatty acid metabolism regulator protein
VLHPGVDDHRSTVALAVVGRSFYYQNVRSDDVPAVRQRTFTEEARRAQIIACAIDVLAELGYAQTSFARVAERLGISKSVISYHFGSKDELLQQVVASVYADGARYIMPRIGAGQPASATLAAYLRSSLEYIRDHSKGIAAIIEVAANARTREGAPRFGAGPGGIEQSLKPLQELLSRGQADGEFAGFDTRTMAWAIRALIDGVPRRQAVDPEFDFEMCIIELIALVDRATRKAGP